MVYKIAGGLGLALLGLGMLGVLTQVPEWAIGLLLSVGGVALLAGF